MHRAHQCDVEMHMSIAFRPVGGVIRAKTQGTLTTMIDQPECQNPPDITLVRIMYIMLN